MTKPLPRPPRHLHIFGVSLVLIVGALAAFLFGMKMEATAPAVGVVVSAKQTQVGAPKAGRVKLATSSNESGTPLVVGSYVAAGAELARIAGDGESGTPVVAPDISARWLVVELPAADGQRVQEGDSIATLVPVAADTGAPLEPALRIEIDEKQFGAVEVGQEVRLYSNMYHHRTHGIGKGVIERLEPMAVEGPNGSRKFRGWVKVTESPFPLKLGASMRAEIVTGRKRTYQIILEH